MVRVPTASEAGLGNLGPARLRSPRQNLQTPPAAFGREAGRINVQVGRQAQAAGDAAFRAAVTAKTNEDSARVKEAESMLGTYMRSRLFLDENAYFGTRGRGAMDGFDPMQKDLYGQRDAIMDTLENEAQKNAFFERSEQRIGGKLTEASRHRLRESRVYQEGQFNAIIEDSIEDAGLDYTPENVASNLERGRAEIAAASDRFGWSAEETAERLENFDSDLYANVINTMLETDPDRARELYNKPAVQKKIEPAARAVIEKNLKTQENKRAIFRNTDELVAKHRRDDGTIDTAAALRDAGKIDDPDVRDGVERQITLVSGREEAIRADNQQRADEAGWQHVLNGGSFDELPASSQNAMSPAARQSANAYSRSRANGEQIKTNWAKYDEWLQMASDLNPNRRDEFLKLNFTTDHRHELADTEMKELVRLQTAIREGQIPDTPGSVANLTQQLSDATSALGWVGVNYAEERGQFQSAVRAAISAEEARLGRDMTYDEIQLVIDAQLLQVEADPDWEFWDRSTWGDATDNVSARIFEIDVTNLSANQRLALMADYDKITPRMREWIRSRFAAEGITAPISNDDVSRAAALFALRDRVGLRGMVLRLKENQKAIDGGS